MTKHGVVEKLRWTLWPRVRAAVGQPKIYGDGRHDDAPGIAWQMKRGGYVILRPGWTRWNRA